MGFWDWFKPSNKHNVVLPSEDSSKLLHGFDLIKAFTTVDEPKVVDYPYTKYKVHWEIFIECKNGGYEAIVRFYDNETNTIRDETLVIKPTVEALKNEVNQIILDTMKQYKR